MPLPAVPIKPSTRHHVVDRRFARLLADDFGVAPDMILTALVGEPQKCAIAICSWAIRQEDPARALLCWAAKHRRGRCRRPREIAPRPARNHSPGQDIAAPREVLRQRRDDSLRGLADVGVLDRIATRLGVS